MNIVVIKEKIKEGLDFVSRAIKENSELPILGNVLIEAEKNKIKMVATNLELASTVFVSGKVIEEGKITIPFSLFYNLINALQTERINIGVKNNVLEVKSDNYKAKIQGVSAEDFPIIPKIKDKEEFIEIESLELKEALSKVILATQVSEIRPELNNIYLNFNIESLVFAATDSFRLAEKTVSDKKFKTNIKNSFYCLLPVKTAAELVRNLKEEGIVKIYKDDSQMLFETENWECISRLSEGNFPDYRQIIPKTFSGEVVLERSEFINAVKLIGVLSSKVNEISIKPHETEKALEIFSSEESAGENDYLLVAKIGGKVKKASFNWKYLNDGLKALKSEEVYLGLNEEKAAMIKAQNDPSYFYILMPILKG